MIGSVRLRPHSGRLGFMKQRRGVFALVVLVVLASSIALLAQKKDDKKQDEAYEDISFVPLAAGQNPMRISRSFTVPAGSYDVYLVAKEPTPDKPPKNAPAPKTSAIRQTVTVPDFWNNEFATSSVIIAQRIDPLAAPLTPQQQADRPYALGQMEILPT